ncbi:Protein of unknown function [Gryllus bimaculatus]|nr:Protein of unknown function [Gryllus bimaculatus]
MGAGTAGVGAGAVRGEGQGKLTGAYGDGVAQRGAEQPWVARLRERREPRRGVPRRWAGAGGADAGVGNKGCCWGCEGAPRLKARGVWCSAARYVLPEIAKNGVPARLFVESQTAIYFAATKITLNQIEFMLMKQIL